MNEQQLTEKLKLIEALFAGAATEGEREAAFNAFQRVKERLDEIKKEDPPKEYQFTMTDVWSKKLFLALLRRYDIKTYRYYRQRRTTVMAKVPKYVLSKEADKVLSLNAPHSRDTARVLGYKEDALQLFPSF